MNRRLDLWAGFFALLLALGVVLFEPPFVTSIAQQSLDVLLRQSAQPPRSDAVVLVDIDEGSLAALGQWPWPRHLLAMLTDQLRQLGAAVVVFDAVFPEQDRTSPVVARDEWSRLAGRDVRVDGIPGDVEDFDRSFAAALRRVKSVLGCYVEPDDFHDDHDPLYRGRFYERGEVERRFLPKAQGLVVSISVLREAAESEGVFNTVPDRDNVVRRTPLFFQRGKDQLYPALSIEAVRLRMGADLIGIHYDKEVGQGVQRIQIRDLAIPTDAGGNLVLNFRSDPFPSVSAASVIAGTFDATAFSNRIVLIGASAAGLRDLRATPMHAETPGIEVHATAVDNMLAGDMLSEPRWMQHVNALATTLVGALLVLLIGRVRAWVGFAAALSCMGLTLAFTAWALLARRFVFLPTGPVFAIAGIYTLMTVVRYWQEERGRRRIREMFETMVSNEVLEFMESHPDQFSLIGRKVEATVFFSDISNFTALAESLDPDVLTSIMNRYLTPMSDIIMRRRGYVDKFYGDAIMAVWGVPQPVEDHAVQACYAALEQKERLAALQRELKEVCGCEIAVRIGINTGLMTAGNMGSERRFQYTVMGDAVNVAARLQEANKEFGTGILIGESTYQLARALIEARCIGPVAIRGKQQTVVAYELLGRKDVSAAG